MQGFDSVQSDQRLIQISKFRRKFNSRKVAHNYTFSFGYGWYFIVILLLVLSNSMLIALGLKVLESRRSQQIKLIGRHRFLSRTFRVVLTVQQLIYDGIIIKSGLRKDTNITTHLPTIRTNLIDLQNMIQMLNFGYRNDKEGDNLVLSDMVRAMQYPCEPGQILPIEYNLCIEIAQGSLRRGILGLLEWYK